MSQPSPPVTQLLQRWKEGEAHVEEDLLRAIYPALRAIAIKRISSDPSAFSLQPTELVHEAYLKLVGQTARWQNREHFFAIAARIMRRILIDQLRRKHSQKRGAGLPVLPLSAALEIAATNTFDWLDLHSALSELEKVDPRAGRIVELRFFAGLSVEETATVLELSSRTVLREWRFARAFLQRQLSDSSSDHV